MSLFRSRVMALTLTLSQRRLSILSIGASARAACHRVGWASPTNSARQTGGQCPPYAIYRQSQRARGACLDGLDRVFQYAVRWLPAWSLPLLADLAHAADEAHHEGGGAHHPAGIPWGTLGLTTVNFALFCYVIGRFVMPAVRGWLRERHHRIVTDLEAAASAKAEALRLRDDWQRRIDQLGETAEEMRTQARLDAERERDRILAAAHKSAETIRRDAERTAAYQVRRTEEQLRAELAKAALQQVEEQVRRKWTAEDQMRFVADFLAQVQS